MGLQEDEEIGMQPPQIPIKPYWAAQMIGSVFIGYIMDFSFKSRRARGIFGILTVAVFVTAIWGGGLAKQLDYSCFNLPDKKLDFKDGVDFAGPYVLYFCHGLLDAMYQSMVYWIIGALSDHTAILSRCTGFYMGVQSANIRAVKDDDEVEGKSKEGATAPGVH